MKRRIVAFVCALLLLGTLPAAALEGEATRAADILTTLQPPGHLPDQDLDAPATRAQAAVLLVELAGASLPPSMTFGSPAFGTSPPGRKPPLLCSTSELDLRCDRHHLPSR